MKTDVIFLLETTDNNLNFDVLAVFPNEYESTSTVMCYAHIGQHSACDISYYKKLTHANKDQYQYLYNELIDLYEYDLNVLNKN